MKDNLAFWSGSRLHINRPTEDHVGLFGRVSGVPFSPSSISNLKLKGFKVIGDHYTGALAGSAVDSKISNIIVTDSEIKGQAFVGSVGGSASQGEIKEVFVEGDTKVSASEYSGLMFGLGIDIEFFYKDREIIKQNLENWILLLPTENEDEVYLGQIPLGTFSLPLTFKSQKYKITCDHPDQ